MFNPQPKGTYKRDKNYLKAICENYGCVITGQKAIPHHLKGKKLGGKKVSDHLVFPLIDKYHSEVWETGIHRNINKWEAEHGTQTSFIKDILLMAVMDGFISQDDFKIAYDQCKQIEKNSE